MSSNIFKSSLNCLATIDNNDNKHGIYHGNCLETVNVCGCLVIFNIYVTLQVMKDILKILNFSRGEPKSKHWGWFCHAVCTVECGSELLGG